ERAVDVGADAVLHLGDEATLVPDVEQRQHHQEGEDQHRLDDDQPDGVLPEGGESVHRALLSTRTGVPAGPSVVWTAVPPVLAGAHTVRSATSATRTGSVTAPRRLRTTTGSPSATPSSASVPAETWTTGLRAVARRCSSPSCITPSSSICRHEASTNSSSASCTGAGSTRAAVARAPSQGPIW